jgi:hypothetical protein
MLELAVIAGTSAHEEHRPDAARCLRHRIAWSMSASRSKVIVRAEDLAAQIMRDLASAATARVRIVFAAARRAA